MSIHMKVAKKSQGQGHCRIMTPLTTIKTVNSSNLEEAKKITFSTFFINLGIRSGLNYFVLQSIFDFNIILDLSINKNASSVTHTSPSGPQSKFKVTVSLGARSNSLDVIRSLSRACMVKGQLISCHSQPPLVL